MASKSLTYNAQLEAIRPWCFAEDTLNQPFKVRVSCAQRDFNVSLPGSKSYTNRALVLASLSRVETEIEGVLFSEDSFWAFESLLRLGFDLRFVSSSSVVVTPPKQSPAVCQLYLGKAGTLARFLPATIVNFRNVHHRDIEVRFEASSQLAQRPITELLNSLLELGADISGDAFPFTLRASALGGRTTISGATSGQFLSGLLLAASCASRPIEIARCDNLVQPDYVRMTLKALGDFGAQIEEIGDLERFKVTPRSSLRCPRFLVEADASTACYFMLFALLHRISLKIENLGSASLQPDLGFFQFLKAMGGTVVVHSESIEVAWHDGALMSHEPRAFDFSKMSDQALTAAAAALFAKAPVEIRGVGHIRHHESDRLSALKQNLEGIGARCDLLDDGFVVYPASNALAGTWKCFDDHRFAMVGFLVASRASAVHVEGAACVAKTAPRFFEMFAKFGASLETQVTLQ